MEISGPNRSRSNCCNFHAGRLDCEKLLATFGRQRYRRRPPDFRLNVRDMHCIYRHHRRFKVRVWVPGFGTLYVGIFLTIGAAERARDQVRAKLIAA